MVERVTFHNEESGFSVLRVKPRGHRDLITVIGHAATIGAGEFVQASGRWVNDRTHGVQFRADFLRSAPTTSWPDLSAQVIRFLISESVSQNRTRRVSRPRFDLHVPFRAATLVYAALR